MLSRIQFLQLRGEIGISLHVPTVRFPAFGTTISPCLANLGHLQFSDITGDGRCTHFLFAPAYYQIPILFAALATYLGVILLV
jgi:hypothetical protein